ncbi:MAG: DNA methyltransferase, partial [Alphaproteobacteria bacterium]|nr:DNA methyltransferase [Alphaproteobacteria bacterium]
VKKDLFDTDTEASDAPGGRRPNLAGEFLEDLKGRLNLNWVADGRGDLKKTFGPEDVFHYMYAVFHSPTYRERYAEFLKIDFPRLPLTSQLKLFRALCKLGAELTGLHLMEEKAKLITKYPVDGTHVVKKITYKNGRVWINDTQYFEGVPEDVWDFQVGGYQVCHKWLKDRKDRELSYDDQLHYQGIVAALKRTIEIMVEIDVAIDAHGGWPLT